ncbi:MAG TPA: hypothetical protein VJ654_19345 [Noviherbaspirillum sp.]|nr:hypothetical protein [Noviherbaspirillum sp.]
MKIYKTLLALLILFIGQQPVIAQISEQEIERREAGAGFILPMAMSLGVLRFECGQWLQGEEDVNQIAKAWWERNRESLDAAIWVSTQAVRRYQATMAPEKAALAQRQIAQVTGDAALANLRAVFASQLPTAQLCKKAIQRYKFQELDVANLSKTLGYERFGEFGEALKRVVTDKDFRPMDEKFRTFDAQVSIANTPLITMDAIEAAKARKDVAGIVRGFESLAARGDSRAAQTLGVFYLNGQYVSRDSRAAQGWFYNSWAMGNPEGINALGVMLRDGIGLSADSKVALAAFAIAKQMASKGSVEAFQRSTLNYSRLFQQLTSTDVTGAGCLNWSDLHSKLRQLAEQSGVTLLAPPKVPQGNLFDSGTLDRGQRDGTSCHI